MKNGHNNLYYYAASESNKYHFPSFHLLINVKTLYHVEEIHTEVSMLVQSTHTSGVSTKLTIQPANAWLTELASKQKLELSAISGYYVICCLLFVLSVIS